MPQLPAIRQDFTLADDPRGTADLLPYERAGRLSQNWADYERTANPRTLRMYQAGISKLVAWHDSRGLPYAFPAEPLSPRVLADWVDDRGEGLKPASVRGYLAGINKMHVLAGYHAPGAALPVKNALSRLDRDLGTVQTQATGLRYDILGPVLVALDAAGADGDLMALRDAALLSVAYDTLCRRSEISALDVSDVLSNADGHSVRVRKSKTDQGGAGSVRFIAPDTFARVVAFVTACRIEAGPLFPPLSAIARPDAGERLAGRDVARVIARHIDPLFAHLPEHDRPHFTGHSARVGSVQDQLAANVDTVKAMQSGGWKSPVMVARYGKDLDAQRSGAAVVAKLQGRV